MNSIKFFFLSSLYPLCSLSPLPCLAPGRAEPPAARRPPGQVAPPATWFAQTGHPNPLDLATWRHPVCARRGPPTKRHGDAMRCRPTASALSLAQARLEPSREHHNALTPLSFLPERESQPHAPLSSWNGRRRHHARRRPLARRGAHPSTLSRAKPTPQPPSLPSTGTPRPARRRPGPLDRRRRRQPPPPPLLLRGAAASGRPAPNRGHPEVALAALMVLPLFPLAAGRRRRRNPASRRLPCSDVRPGAYPREENVFQGSLCKKKFFFLFVFQASKLAKSI